VKSHRPSGARLRNAGRIAAVLVALTLGACREADLTGPDSPADAAPPCTTADCTTFRALTPTTIAPLLASTSRIATTSLTDAALGRRIADRITTLQSEINAGDKTDAQVAMLSLLVEIDNAMADSARRADLADLSSMRLNLEPVVIYLGLR
jgi:hypothetical protein